MDAFDFTEPKLRRRRRTAGEVILNMMTGCVLIVTAVIALIIIMIFINPGSQWNPYAPPASITPFFTPTATVTGMILLPPTWTPAPTQQPSPTFTPRPSSTPYPTETPYWEPTPTLGDTPTPGGFDYVVQQGSPQSVPNIYHPELGCNWTGIGGQVLDKSRAPVVGMIVELGGTLEGRPYETKLTITGTATQYDRGGFEFTIADKLVESKGTLYLQLLDMETRPLSDKIYFDTFNDCQRNLNIIYFVQVK